MNAGACQLLEELTLEKRQHEIARIEFAKEIAEFKKTLGVKDDLIHELTAEVVRYAPNLDIVRRVREHRDVSR